MSLVIAIIFTFILCYFGYVSYRNYQFKQILSWMPNVPGWPVVGNALEFGDTKRLLSDISRLVPKTEKFVFLTFLDIGNIFTTNEDFAEFVLSGQNVLSKSSDYNFVKKWLGTGLLTSDGAKWKPRRRITTPAFHFSILEDFVDVFESNGKILVNKLKNFVDQNSVDIYPFITLYALDVIGETAMGVQFHAQDNESSEYVKNVKVMCKIGIIRSTSVVKNFDLLYPLTLDYWREKSALKQLHAATNSVIVERRKKMDGNVVPTVDEFGRKKRMAFLDILLNSNINGSPLSQEDIREEVDTFMFEGHDTTASAMTFCMYFVANHPDVQKRIMEEQRDIFGDDILRDSKISDLQQMKYLECVIKETLRLCPSVPMYGRHTTQDMIYKGNIVPKGINIVIYAYGMLHDPDYYPEPEKFDPSRFENVDGKWPFRYLPFSAGPRNCIGQKFAMLEMKATISQLMRNFEVFPAIPEHKLILVPEAVLKSANGVRIRFATRKH